MGQRLFEQLWPWIVGSLLLLVVIVLFAIAVPSVECGAEGPQEEGGDALVVVTIFATVLAVGSGLYRLVAMVGGNSFARRDGWIFAAALAVLAAAALVGGLVATPGGGLATGGLILPGLTLVGLVAAAIAGRSAEDVGVLLPIYLFGAAYVYLAIGLITLLAKSGIGC
jgi:hypothetical protein